MDHLWSILAYIQSWGSDKVNDILLEFLIVGVLGWILSFLADIFLHLKRNYSTIKDFNQTLEKFRLSIAVQIDGLQTKIDDNNHIIAQKFTILEQKFELFDKKLETLEEKNDHVADMYRSLRREVERWYDRQENSGKPH